jgi:hypothetical protein
MLLPEYKKKHPKHKNPRVDCNALYKTENNVNCYLTAAQAVELANNLIHNAKLIEKEGLEDAAVQLWNQGKEKEHLYCGLHQARKGARRVVKS